jgi:RNA polymerase sigma factor (sigma-70 family)
LGESSGKVLIDRQAFRLGGEEHMSTITVPSACGGSLTLELEKVFREHAQMMYRSALSVTGRRQDAEDVLQNIFLKLLQREVPIEFRINPKGYLYRAAVNRALDVVRSRKQQSFTNDVERLAEVRTQGEVVGEFDVNRRLLLDAIGQLRPRAVEILILYYEHNYSVAEIAKMLGTSRSTIAVTLFRTRARLKRLMSRAASSSGANQ